MKLLLFLLLASVQLSCAEELVFSEADRGNLLAVAKQARMLTTNRDIPQEVIRACRKEKEDFALANPGENFQSTDAVIWGPGTPPRRRLIWGARLGTFCVLHYEKGGHGSPKVLVVTSIVKAGEEAEIIWSEYGKKMSFEDFISALKLRQLKRGADRL